MRKKSEKQLPLYSYWIDKGKGEEELLRRRVEKPSESKLWEVLEEAFKNREIKRCGYNLIDNGEVVEA